MNSANGFYFTFLPILTSSTDNPSAVAHRNAKISEAKPQQKINKQIKMHFIFFSFSSTAARLQMQKSEVPSSLEGSFIAQPTMETLIYEVKFPLSILLHDTSLWYFTDDIKIGNDNKRTGNAYGEAVERVPERSKLVLEVHRRISRRVYRFEEPRCWRHEKHSRSLQW